MSRSWTGNNRAPWHDYTARCIYHITLLKHPSAPPFGTLAGDFRLPISSPGSPHLRASATGRAIKECLRNLPSAHPQLRLFQYALMPDHLHIVLSVEQPLDETIGRKIGYFKLAVNKLTGLDQVFEHGYNDQILTKQRSLDTIFRYLKANPYRLAIRRANPDFFLRKTNVNINDLECQLFGNHHLLDNPFKAQVVVHRADTDDEFARNRDIWLHIAANGGVLVSPFISKKEKEIQLEAEMLGGKFILITNKPFADREKPSGKYFDLCTEGRLLTVAPMEQLIFYRAICMQMNKIAQRLTCAS